MKVRKYFAIFGKPSPDLDYQCKPTELVMVDILNPQDILLKSISVYEQSNGPEKDVYFYHGDHLGSASWITDYTGAPIQYIHYAPYGELIANQQMIGYDERYKFTGKERDAETGYDYFGARYLWGDAGTWLSVDRFANKYPGLSPYAYCAWNPVRNIDIHGDSIFIVQGKNNLLYKDGKLYNSDNTLYTGKVSRYTKSVMQAFENISATAEGNAMISELQNSTNNFSIRRGESNKFKAANPMAAANLDEIKKVNPHASSNGSGGYIYWNPYSTCGGLNENGNTYRPAYIGLAHEFIHARDANNGGLFPSEVYGSYTPIYDGVLKCEWRAVYFENIIRSQAGLPLRTYYGYRTDGSTYWGVGPKMLSPDGKLINYPIF